MNAACIVWGFLSDIMIFNISVTIFDIIGGIIIVLATAALLAIS
jgi:hypothetical protein